MWNLMRERLSRSLFDCFSILTQVSALFDIFPFSSDFFIYEVYVRHAVSMVVDNVSLCAYVVGVGPTKCSRSIISRNVRLVLLS